MPITLRIRIPILDGMAWHNRFSTAVHCANFPFTILSFACNHASSCMQQPSFDAASPQHLARKLPPHTVTRDCPQSRHVQVTGLGLAPCLACAPARALPRHCLAAARILPAALTDLAKDPSHSCAIRHVSYRQGSTKELPGVLCGITPSILQQSVQDNTPMPLGEGQTSVRYQDKRHGESLRRRHEVAPAA